MAVHMLTTVDNPFNPFTQYDEWYDYDIGHGYNSAALLGRIAKLSDDLSDEQNSAEIERAIDEIVTENVSGFHTKIAEPVAA